MMTLVLIIVLTMVAVVATAVVLTKDPKPQAVTLSLYGLLLALLFLVLHAPDVALSQVAVGGAVVPLLVLLTMRTLERERR
jgi:energy-converting hydrogenase B subunit D